MIKLDAQNLESRESKAPENALPVYEPGSMSADELKHQTKSDAKLHRERETARREKYAAIIRLIDTV